MKGHDGHKTYYNVCFSLYFGYGVSCYINWRSTLLSRFTSLLKSTSALKQESCRWNPPFFFYQLWDQTANIICSENELCSCHIVFLIARLHHVQSNLKQNNRQRLLHLCGAPAGRAGRYSTADNGRVPNWRFSRFNSAPCRPAIELWSHSCDFHSCWMF